MCVSVPLLLQGDRYRLYSRALTIDKEAASAIAKALVHHQINPCETLTDFEKSVVHQASLMKEPIDLSRI